MSANNLSSSFSSNLSVRLAEHEKVGLLRSASQKSSSPTLVRIEHHHVEFDDAGDLRDPPVSLLRLEHGSPTGSFYNSPLDHRSPSKISPNCLESQSSQLLTVSELEGSLPDLSVSPLTASSFHVMEREYDRDTWRMFNRITAARNEKTTIHVSAETTIEFQQIQVSSEGTSYFPVEDDSLDDDFEDDTEDMFDLDLV